MAKVMNWVTRLAVAAALCSSSLAMAADAPKGRGVARYSVKASGIAGEGASANVQASLGTVRGVITDFGRYGEFMKPFQSSKIVGRSGDKTSAMRRAPGSAITLKPMTIASEAAASITSFSPMFPVAACKTFTLISPALRSRREETMGSSEP